MVSSRILTGSLEPVKLRRPEEDSSEVEFVTGMIDNVPVTGISTPT